MPDAFFFEKRDLIIALSARYRPTTYFSRVFVQEGGLISYGADFAEEVRQAAGYIDRILKGAMRADGETVRTSGFAMEIIRKVSITTLANSGVQSEQLLFPENSSSRRITITKITVQPQAVNPTHRHPASEQVWVALQGSGMLLLDGERTEPFAVGDVVRFADGDLHGFRNNSDVPFVYLSVTAPPVNFREAYAKDWKNSG
jgi:quercetin dioxygenase-like cupin family protein